MTIPTATVVICAYTLARRDALRAAVRSVQRQTQPAAEVLVVIDHNQALEEWARNELAGARIVPNEGAPGLAAARNAGLLAGTKEIVVFLDDDAEAEPTWLARLLAGYTDASVLGVGGSVEPKWLAKAPRWLPSEFGWVLGCSYRGLPESGGPVRNLLGCNMSFRHQELVAAGGFKVGMGRIGTRPVGCEETELCIRLQAQHPGRIFLYEPAARVSHLVPPERARWSYFLQRCCGEGRSKAQVTATAGRRKGLATEWTFVRHTLPAGVGRNLAASLRHADPGGAARAAAIVGGLAAVTAGYVRGTLASGGSLALRGGAIKVGGAAGAAGRLARASGLILLAGAAALLAVLPLGVADSVDLRRMGDLGLLPLLPVATDVGLVAMLAVFLLALHRRRVRRWELAFILLVTVGVLFSLTALTEREARFGPVYKHAALIHYITQHRGVDTGLDAYFAWPGFFVTAATLFESAGLPSPLAVANLAPIFFQLLYLLPLYLITASLTDDERHRWGALLLFYLGNWVGQDYFAPQALALFFYLMLLGVALRWLRPRGALRLPRRLADRLSERPLPRAQAEGVRLALTLLLFLAVFLAVVISHPLTPFLVPAAAAALVVLRLARPLWLPLVLAAIAVAWTNFVARDFLSGHLYLVTGSAGKVGQTLDSSLAGRLIGSPGHLAVVLSQVGAALAIGLLALAGGWMLLRRRRVPLAGVTLAAVPLVLPLVQSYGGEVLLRTYLFALPFLAFFAAAALWSTGFRPSRLRSVAAAATCCVLLGAFALSKYGNERQEYVSPQEMAAAQWLHAALPYEGVVVSAMPNGGIIDPRDIYRVQEDQLQIRSVRDADVQAVAQQLEGYGQPSYLLLSRGQEAFADMSSGLRPGSLRRLQSALERSPLFQVVFSNADATVITLSTPVMPSVIDPAKAMSALRDFEQRLLKARLQLDRTALDQIEGPPVRAVDDHTFASYQALATHFQSGSFFGQKVFPLRSQSYPAQFLATDSFRPDGFPVQRSYLLFQQDVEGGPWRAILRAAEPASDKNPTRLPAVDRAGYARLADPSSLAIDAQSLAAAYATVLNTGAGGRTGEPRFADTESTRDLLAAERSELSRWPPYGLVAKYDHQPSQGQSYAFATPDGGALLMFALDYTEKINPTGPYKVVVVPKGGLDGLVAPGQYSAISEIGVSIQVASISASGVRAPASVVATYTGLSQVSGEGIG